MPLREEDARVLEALGHARADFAHVDADGILTLQNVPHSSGDGRRHCFFLKDDLCSVYDSRPAGCRFYPFVLDPTAKRVVRDEDCPWRREFPQEPAVGRRLLAAWTAVASEAGKRLRKR